MRRRTVALLIPSLSLPWLGGLLVLSVTAGSFFGVRLSAGNAGRARPITVLVDPGHGGVDGGCGGSGAAILEKDLNLLLAAILARRLQRFGLRVELTRSDDRHLAATHRQDLLARVKHAEDARADLVICLHADWSWDRGRKGLCVFYHRTSCESRALAEMIQSELNAAAGSGNRALPSGDLLVIREVKRPAVLVEVGFLSNPGEARKLVESTYQHALAEAVATGVVRYLLSAA